MFNKFFKGTVEDLFNQMDTPEAAAAIKQVGDKNQVLTREEIVAFIMDEAKCPQEEAERIATEIQLEEFNRIIQPMIEKGLVELVGYDDEGLPKYMPTQKGTELLG